MMTVIVILIAVVAFVALSVLYAVIALAGDLDQKDEDRYGVEEARRS